MQAAAPTRDEAGRLALLRRIGILDSAGEDAFDGLVECASRMLDMPIALVSLVDEQRQWFKAAVGLATRETPREFAFSAHAIHCNELFEVEDASLDPRFADNPLVTGEPKIRFYAGQPLAVDSVNLGTLCVIDTRPRRLDEGQRRSLKRLAAVAAELLASRQRLTDLYDEKQRLLDFARAAGDWWWETDAELHYTFVSSGIGAAIGLAPADLVGRALTGAALLDETGQPRAGAWQELLEQRSAFSGAVTEQRIGDRLVHVSHSAAPLW
ncbi:MAG: GAF domain-containing protein, partial [Burkholderiaceae bacterium]